MSGAATRQMKQSGRRLCRLCIHRPGPLGEERGRGNREASVPSMSVDVNIKFPPREKFTGPGCQIIKTDKSRSCGDG